MKKILSIVLVSLMCMVISSCNEHQNNTHYNFKVINKCDSMESRVIVVTNGKMSMPMRQWMHCYYLTVQYQDLSEPNLNWSEVTVMGVNSEIYEKYQIGHTYLIDGHTHIEKGDSVPTLCWKSL